MPIHRETAAVCAICQRPDVRAINSELADGASFGHVARAHGVPKTSLRRHAQHAAAVTQLADAIAALDGAVSAKTVPASAPASEISVEPVPVEPAPSPAPTPASVAPPPAAERDARAQAALEHVRAELHVARERWQDECRAGLALDAQVAQAKSAIEARLAEANATHQQLDDALARVLVADHDGAPPDELAAAQAEVEAITAATHAAQAELAQAKATFDETLATSKATIAERAAATKAAEDEVRHTERMEAALARVAGDAHTAAGVERLAHLRAEHERLKAQRAEAAHALDVASQELQDFYARGLAHALQPWPEIAVQTIVTRRAQLYALLAPSAPISSTREVAEAILWLLQAVERVAGEPAMTIGGSGIIPLLEALGGHQSSHIWRTLFERGGRERAELELRPLRQMVAHLLQIDARELERQLERT